MRFIKAHLHDFIGGTGNVIVHGDKIAIEMAGPDEQKWVWHNANSVSFNVRVKYEKAVNNAEVASIDSLWEARLYRDKVNQPWQRILGFERSKMETGRTKFGLKELRDLPRGVPK